MEKPLVSVSLVAFNAQAFIREAIESCLMQEVDFDYEIIIHDDASTDQTPIIIKEYADRFPDKIAPILQIENQFSQGKEINAQIIIPRAKGKYIAFLEADDYWIDPLKLQKVIDYLESQPDTAMCFTATKHIFPHNPDKIRFKRYRKHDAICTIEDIILMGGRLVDMGSAVVRRSVFENMPEWYFYKQIWDITIPLLSYTHGHVKYLDTVTSVYRYSVPGSWTQKNIGHSDRRRSNLEKSVKMYDAFDQDTNHQYQSIINKKLNTILVEILLLSKPEDDGFSDFYARLPFSQKLIYKSFSLLGSFRLWERYRQIKRLVIGY
jgi:glycosyltransferase involved in cell wall biosynthesis